MKVHTVQKGDSLWKISKMHGVPLDSVIAANPQIANPDMIDVGMKINIPNPHGQQSPMPAPVPTPGPASPFPMPHAQMPQTQMPQMQAPQQGQAPQMQVPQEDAPLNKMPMGAEMGELFDQMMQAPPDTGAPETPDAMPTEQPDLSTPPAPPAVPATPEPAYPSVPKWEGLWKYVVKNGDSLFKIAKQVGVTLDQLKAANPQVPNADKIYPGQVLNIPSSGMKIKKSNPHNPGLSPKEQMTMPIQQAPMQQMPLSPKEQMTMPIQQAPMLQMPLSPKEQMTMPIQQAPISPKEILTQPKEMVTMEKPTPQPPMAPVAEKPPMMMPIDIDLQYHPEIHIQQQQQQMMAPVQVPVAVPMHHVHMMYIPVTYKKHKKKCHHKKKHHKCQKKVKIKKCGHHHHPVHYPVVQHPGYHMLMQQQMTQQLKPGTYPKTFYREED